MLKYIHNNFTTIAKKCQGDIKKLKDFKIKNRFGDLWSYLQNTDKTVVMYGMGNGADKILAVCGRYGIEVADFFASDGFVRGHMFHGKRVLSFGEIKERYGERITSRLFGEYRPIIFSGTDIREQKIKR